MIRPLLALTVTAVVGILLYAITQATGPGAAPTAIPLWLGWVIGLIPVWALLGFVLIQAARAWRSGVW